MLLQQRFVPPFLPSSLPILMPGITFLWRQSEVLNNSRNRTVQDACDRNASSPRGGTTLPQETPARLLKGRPCPRARTHRPLFVEAWHRRPPGSSPGGWHRSAVVPPTYRMALRVAFPSHPDGRSPIACRSPLDLRCGRSPSGRAADPHPPISGLHQPKAPPVGKYFENVP